MHAHLWLVVKLRTLGVLLVCEACCQAAHSQQVPLSTEQQMGLLS